jgi:hypothetical protein
VRREPPARPPRNTARPKLDAAPVNAAEPGKGDPARAEVFPGSPRQGAPDGSRAKLVFTTTDDPPKGAWFEINVDSMVRTYRDVRDRDRDGALPAGPQPGGQDHHQGSCATDRWSFK